MRKSAALCGILLGVFLLGSTAQAETVARAMNFRSEPSATAGLIGSVPKGAQVTVLGSKNGWDNVSYNGVTGWIHGGNITGTSSAQNASGSAAASTGTSASAAGTSGQSVKVLYGMNFRAKPGMDGRIMGGIPAGTIVQFLGSSNGWDKVVYNGVTGWIASGRTAAAGSAAPASTGTSASAAGTSGQYVKVLYGMNFRARPRMDGRIKGFVPAGSTVQYLRSKNGWDKVIYNGVKGWIASGRTAPAGTAAQSTAASSAAEPIRLVSSAGTSMTVINTMNFRLRGGVNEPLIGVIPSGAKVIYVSSADGWQQVIYNGMSGWIKGGNTR